MDGDALRFVGSTHSGDEASGVVTWFSYDGLGVGGGNECAHQRDALRLRRLRPDAGTGGRIKPDDPVP